MFQVVFYEDSKGRQPVKDFLNSLRSKSETSKSDRIRFEKAMQHIRILQKYGARAGLPYMKHIEGGLWELRPLRDRIFFCSLENNRFVLLHHFMKKSQKTPVKEIERAKRNMNDV